MEIITNMTKSLFHYYLIKIENRYFMTHHNPCCSSIHYVTCRIYSHYFRGETAFHNMRQSFAWAKNPMIRRFQSLREDIPVTVLYGEKSWIKKVPDEIFIEKRPRSYLSIEVSFDKKFRKTLHSSLIMPPRTFMDHLVKVVGVWLTILEDQIGFCEMVFYPN